MDDEHNTERVVIQHELKQEQQHVREIKTERVFRQHIVDQLQPVHLVVRVVVEVIIKLVIQVLVLPIDGQ